MLNSSQLSATAKKMVEEGKAPKIVCFDYFDTLIVRSVYPEATKQLAAKQLCSLLGNNVEWQTLYDLRAGCEKKICQDSADNGFDQEFSLDELASSIYEIITKTAYLPAWIDKERFIENFSAIEIQTEKRVQVVCPVMRGLLRYLKGKKVQICLVSDFYFSQHQFRKLLEFHCLDSYFINIFISAEYKLSKGGSGKLYREIAQEMNCQLTDMLMIGDSTHADYEMSKRVGMNALQIDRKEQYIKYEEYQKTAQNGSAQNNHLTKNFERILRKQSNTFFPEMGVSLWLFIHRLFSQLIIDNVPEVFFCSKEGEFLKKLFSQYQDQCFGTQIIKSHYLLVSRKATFICSLRPLKEEDFSRLFVHYSDMSLKEFILSLNFSEKEAKELCEINNLDFEKKHQNLKDTDEFSLFLKSLTFQQKYETHRHHQKDNFLRYIKSFNSSFEESGVVLVDVGWKGSIQNNIYYTLGGKISVRGYYIGLLSPTELRDNNQKFGLLFSDVPQLSAYIHVYNNNRSLFEMLLGATHGSADGYFTTSSYNSQKNDRESVGQFCSDTEKDLVVTLLDLPEERKLFREQILPVQDTVLSMNFDFTEQYCQYVDGFPSFEWFAKRHARMVFRPTKREVEYFSKLYHLENFGLFEFTDFLTQQNIPILDRIRNLRKLIQDPAAFLETGTWPPVILRRLGLDFLQSIDGNKRYKRIFHDSSIK